jgi:hypothetical protein
MRWISWERETTVLDHEAVERGRSVKMRKRLPR